MLADPRPFSLGAILSVTTGRLLADIGDVHELLDFMTGDTLFTHQLPRAIDEACPVILRQHADLAEAIAPADFDGPEGVNRWLAAQIGEYGPDRYLRPMDPADHTVIDPLAELRMRAPHIEVISIVTPEAPDAG